MLNGDVRFDVGTIGNARDLLQLCATCCPLPMDVAKGYWATLSISWPGFELEVFEDRIEVYRFRSDGGTDIWYESHSLGQAFSDRLLEELPRG